MKAGSNVFAVAAIAAAMLLSRPVLADDPPAAEAPVEPAKKAFDVKATFRNICGFCHEDYGRKAGKGPQLMNDPNTDDFLVNRIKTGKPGRMAAFGSIFTDDQIHQIVSFIRTLRPDVDP